MKEQPYENIRTVERIGSVGSPPQQRRRGRELALTIVGGLVGLALVVVVWMLAGQSAEAPLPAVAEVNRPAPDFALPTLDGQTIRLADYRGNVVLVNFWGSWCEPCQRETPELQRTYERLRSQGLVIIGVDLWNQEGSDAERKVRSFIDTYKITYPIALDTDGKTANEYRLYPIPTSYFVDPQGNIRYIKASVLTEAEIEALFNRLRQRPASN